MLSHSFAAGGFVDVATRALPAHVFLTLRHSRAHPLQHSGADAVIFEVLKCEPKADEESIEGRAVT